VDPLALKRWGLRALIVLACGAGLWALLLLAHSAENSGDFNRRQPWILLLNSCAVIALAVLLARKLWQLYRDFKDHVPGSRLTVRTVVMFGSLVVVPLLIVYLFALEFLNYGIDSWFRGETRQGLNDALELSRSALDLRLHEQSRRTENFARGIAGLTGTDLALRLDAQRREAQAANVTVYDRDGRAVAISSRASSLLPAAGKGCCYRWPPAANVSLEAHPNGSATIVTAAPLRGP
jgi:nitrogen fixation/metabolism regulation signal transduction histidine kinase